ncbi:hypothetical protein LCGC14_2523790 [marine sediment metagenome]|uniref:Uncharacterized protein n=1 Tax=marine sediment metagenome TaxID=412755 RepID=A0A0F9AW11_9ZZZZ
MKTTKLERQDLHLGLVAAYHMPVEEMTDIIPRLLMDVQELLEVATGALGFLRDLPLGTRPDRAWLSPLIAAVSEPRQEVDDDS